MLLNCCYIFVSNWLSFLAAIHAKQRSLFDEFEDIDLFADMDQMTESFECFSLWICRQICWVMEAENEEPWQSD